MYKQDNGGVESLLDQRKELLEELINSDIIDEEHGYYDDVKGAIESNNSEQMREIIDELLSSGFIYKDDWDYKLARKLLKEGKKFDLGGSVDDSDDYGTFEIYKNGGSIEVNVVNSDKKYNEKEYDWILGDKDKDGVANADDTKPLDKTKSELIDTPSITTGIKSLISLKKSLDSTMFSFIDDLKNVAPDNSKIYARTKTPYSVLDKLIKKRLSTITDLIGTTIVTSDKKELDSVKKYIDSGKLGKIIELEDMYKNPKGGYRAYHYLIERNGMSIELQLKTKRQKALNELSHEPYKLGKINSALLLKITEIANRADEGDKGAINEYNEFMKTPNIENVFYAEKMVKGGSVGSEKVKEGDILISDYIDYYKLIKLGNGYFEVGKLDIFGKIKWSINIPEDFSEQSRFKKANKEELIYFYNSLNTDEDAEEMFEGGGKVKNETMDKMNKFAVGGEIGNQVTFSRYGERTTGKIIDKVRNGYEVVTNEGTILVEPQEVISFSDAPMEKKKRFGFFEGGGSIGFIPIDLEEKLMTIAKWGGISIKGVIGILNAMIDSGITDGDLTPKPIKNTRFQIERAEEKKIQDIWKEIQPKYNGTLKGNQYYSTIKELIQYSNDDILKRYKPFRKYQFEGGGSIGFKERSERDSIKLAKAYQKVFDSNFEDKEYNDYEKIVKETQIPKEELQKIEHYISTTPKGQQRMIDIYRYWGVKYEGGGEIEGKISDLQAVVDGDFPQFAKDKAKAEIEKLEKELHESKETKAEEKEEHKAGGKPEAKKPTTRKAPVKKAADKKTEVKKEVETENDNKKRFELIFYYGSNTRNYDKKGKLLEPTELIIRANDLENAISQSIKKAKDLNAKNFEIYYKDLFVGSVDLMKSNDFIKGRGYNDFIKGEKPKAADKEVQPQPKFKVGERVVDEDYEGNYEILEIKYAFNPAEGKPIFYYNLNGKGDISSPEYSLKKYTKPKADHKKLLAKIKAKKGAAPSNEPSKGHKRSESSDRKREALPLGKRVSADGSVYYENRLNRADMNKEDKFKEGGEIGENNSGWGLKFLKW